MQLGLACLLTFALVATVTSSVEAQSWIVVPVVVGSPEDADLSSARAHAAISAELARSSQVIEARIARDRFEARGSSSAVAATHGDIDQLARDAQQALYHVAMGLYTSASADVKRVLERADRALESLNRETIAARHLLDSCLFIVRARLQERKARAARDQALECRRLVPDIEPDPSIHPPDVIGEVAAAEAEIGARRSASLRVTSEPTGCAAFVQGRNLGMTPLELQRLSPGEYRIQAECVPGEYGRVHRVTLGTSRAVVHVDSHLDVAVQTGSGISLRYGTASSSTRLAVRHATEVARVIGAQRVALIVPDPVGSGWVRISALEVESGKLAAEVFTQVGPGGEVAHLRDAVTALRAGRSTTFGGPRPTFSPRSEATEPVVSSTTGTPAPSPVQAETHGRNVQQDNADTEAVVWTIAAVGAATHVTGWVLYTRTLALEADYRKVRDLTDTSEAERRLARLDDFTFVPPLVGAGGAVVTTAAMPWLLPKASARGVPVWAFAAGGAGAALATIGAVFLVRGASCEEHDRFTRCDDVPTTSHLGLMLLDSAAPLLSVPVVYFVRSLGVDASQDLSLAPMQHGAVVYWRGTL